MQPTINDILNFPHSLKCKGLSYSSVNAARSILSAFITVEGYDVGNSKQILPKYSFTWDVGVVLNYLP